MDNIIEQIQNNFHTVVKNTENLRTLIELLYDVNLLDNSFDRAVIKTESPSECYDSATSVFRKLLDRKPTDREHILWCLSQSKNTEVIKILEGTNNGNLDQEDPRIWFDIYPPVYNFVGRENELQLLCDNFIPLKTESKFKCVNIIGGKGIGKTQLALRFAEKFYLDNKGHCVFLSDDNNFVYDSFLQLAKEFDLAILERYEHNNLDELFSLIEDVCNKLVDRPCLLIIDNVVNCDSTFFKRLLQEYCSAKNCYLILISQLDLKVNISSVGQIKQIKIECLPLPIVKTYFRNTFPKQFNEKLELKSIERNKMAAERQRTNDGKIGNPIQIINIQMDENHPSRMTLDSFVTRDILDRVGNRKVVLISMAGPSRLGKSFLLSFMVRYLAALENDELDDWIGRNNLTKPLEGFSFKNGMERMTTGIWLWSRPFIIKNAREEEIAVLLMDTQGVFDSHTTIREWSAIVGISLLTSSCFIYNVVHNFQEDALEFLETFMQFGVMMMEKSESRDACFQKLVLLVRDWNMPGECEYGAVGGKIFLEKKLQINATLSHSSVRVRETIQRCFSERNCYLMPNPGEKAKGNEFNGKLEDLDKHFIDHLLLFMDKLLSPEELVPMKSEGQFMKANELLIYFQKYTDLFNSRELPNPTNMLDATAHAGCELLVMNALEDCRTKLMEIVTQLGFINRGDWDAIYEPLKVEALRLYDSKRKLGDPRIAERQRKRLVVELSRLLTEIKGHNEEMKRNECTNEKEKLIARLKSNISAQLEKGFFLQEKLEEIIARESSDMVNSFCRTFGENEEFLDENLPLLREQMRKVAEEFEKENDEKIYSASQVTSVAIRKSVEKYKKEMELKFGENGGEVVCSDETMEKMDETCRSQAFEIFHNVPKDGPPEFYDNISEELVNEINVIFAVFATKNAERRASQQINTEKLIAEFEKLYLSEISELLAQETEPDSMLLERTHLRLLAHYSRELMTKSEIKHTDHFLPFEDKLRTRLEGSFESAKQLLLAKQEEVKQNKHVEIDRLVLKHHNNIVELMNDKQICTEYQMKQNHEKIAEFCRSKLNLPRFLTPEENKRYYDILNDKLAQDFHSLCESYKKKTDEANTIAESVISDLVEAYRMKMNNIVANIFEKVQLDEYHEQEKAVLKNEMTKQLNFFPAEIYNAYQTKLLGYLEDTYKSIVHLFEQNLEDMEQRIVSVYQDSVVHYCELMEKRKSQSGMGKEALNSWHELNKEKAINLFERNVRTVKIDYEPQRKKLERQLSDEFQGILHFQNAQEDDIKKRAETIMHDSLKQFEGDIQNVVGGGKFAEEVTFLKKLNEAKTATKKYFYDRSAGIRGEIINKTLEELNDEVERRYILAAENFRRQKEEHSSLRDISIAKCVSEYESKMETQIQESNLVSMSQLQEAHQKFMKEAIEKIPSDCLESAQYVVQEKIPKLYENYAQMHEIRLNDAERENEESVAAYKSNISTLIREKTTEANQPAELEAFQDQLEQRALEFLKSFRYFGGATTHSQQLNEINNHIKQEILVAIQEIQNREPDETTLGSLKETTMIIYDQEMQKHFDESPLMAADVLKVQHDLAVERAMQNAKALQQLTPKATADLQLMLKSAFIKYQNMSHMNSSDEPAIGIDLGTTFSCVAIYMPAIKAVRILPNENTKNTTPSYVAFARDGTQLVGEPAKNQAHANPENTIFDAKRLIGRPFNDPIVQRDIELWPFKVINEKGAPKIQVGDKSYHPEEISAKVLIKMKEIAEMHLNRPVKNAVITVPAYFTDGQKQATKDAGRVAGLNVLSILSEPTAAAIAFNCNETFGKRRNVLIFDFGGGTFDVAILQMYNGEIDVKAVDGDTHLGGEDFDSALVDYCVTQFKEKEGIDLVSDRTAEEFTLRFDCNRRIRRLRDECEKQKINLSGATTSTVALACIYQAKDIHVEITRATFERINNHYFEKAISIVKRALEAAQLTTGKIDDIVLVGGSTRIPKVQELLTNLFDGKNLNRSINPDEAVATGAAIQAAILNGCSAEELKNIKLYNVTPLSIGIEVRGGRHSIIIPKNTSIPTQKEETYTTTLDDQTVVGVKIYEGEAKSTKDNTLLGKFDLTGIPKAKAGTPDLKVSMEIDTNGILNVAAKCVGANSSGSLKIVQNKGRLTEGEIRRLARSQ